MEKRIADFFRSDLGVLVLVATARVALHVATNGQYGFHRDELQTFDDARHLDWGFVVYPPVTPLIGRLELLLFGSSLIGFRFFEAVAVSAIMVLTGLIAKELGGTRHIQLLEIWKITSRLHDQFREEIGWPDLARSVANVYHSLPIEEREHTGILAGNYGEAGALNLYGPVLGLPHAMGLTNSFWYRGYDPRLPQTVIVAGFDLEEGRKLFGSCLVASKNTNLFGVENEESRDHPDILLCRDLRMPWSVYWERHRGFG